MPVIPAIPALISAGTSIIGGITGGKAAGNAANDQVGATQDAQRKIDQSVADANAGLSTAGDTAISRADTAAKLAQTGISDASQTGIQRVDAGTADANAQLGQYVTLGNGAVSKLSDLVKNSDQGFQFSQDDPSYQWRLQQGEQALQRAAAAKGAVSGGAAAKQMTRYGQGAASQEYQAAFDRWNTGRSTTYNMLSGIAGMGEAATGKTGDNTMSGARYGSDLGYTAARTAGDIGVDAAQFGGKVGVGIADSKSNNAMQAARTNADLLMQAGDARAAGVLGQANAKNQIIGGIGSGVLSLANLIKSGKQPAAPPVAYPDIYGE